MFHKLKRYFPHMLDWKFGKYMKISPEYVQKASKSIKQPQKTRIPSFFNFNGWLNLHGSVN